jgi:hypothetical protein
MSEDDVVIKELRHSGLFSPDASDDEVWAQYRDHQFSLLTRQGRKSDLDWVDNQLDAEKVLKATREDAKLVQRRRELKNIDEALWRANR